MRKSSDSGAAEFSESHAGPSRQGKHRSLSNLDVAILVASRMTFPFLPWRRSRKRSVKWTWQNFVFSHNSKSRQEVIESAWKIQNAPDTIARSELSPIEIVNKAASGACSEGCNGLWLTCAIELLRNNAGMPIFSQMRSESCF